MAEGLNNLEYPGADVEPEETMDRTREIVRRIAEQFGGHYHGALLPESYLCFDTETTGFDPRNAVILQWGHCLVEDRQPADRLSVYVNWIDYPVPGVSPEYVQRRIKELQEIFAEKGSEFLTEEDLRKYGVPPQEAADGIYRIVQNVLERGLSLVAHNGWRYDVPMVGCLFERMHGQYLEPDDESLFDTGSIEKASQVLHDNVLLPFPNEGMRQYFTRVAERKMKGVKWALDTWCVPKYDLAGRYNLDSTQMHGAGQDAYVVHLLFEEYRRMAEQEAAA